ncbi:MAG: hypothetical protein JW833_00915, partial [Prolixibacteraceae bacterium]|nr:hypothetical protein [Prolixibacteraceae bacterium]
DIILVGKKPSVEYIHLLEDLGFKDRRFVTYKEAFSEEFLRNENLDKLLPWGWSPATHHFLYPLKNSCSNEFNKGIHSPWNEEYKKLSGKNQAIKILRQITDDLKYSFLLPKEKIGIECHSVEDIETAINRWGKIMVKAPWSTSGRGLQPVTQNPIHPSIKNRIKGMIDEQGFVIVEPLLKKILNLAFQFKSKMGNIEYLGDSFFETDEKGQYRGNYLNGLPEGINEQLNDFIKTIQPIKTLLIKVLKNQGYAEKYEGFFGVDTLIYSDENGELKINPCLEINLRYNMGLLSLILRNVIAEGLKGMFRIYYDRGNSFQYFSEKMQKDFPVIIQNNKIRSGFYPLTDLQTDSVFGAYLILNS